MLLSLVLSLSVYYLFPSVILNIYPYNLLGVPVILAGFVLTMWTRQIIESHRTTLDPQGTPSNLITNKAFSFSRNPIYLGQFLITLGLSVILASPLSLIGPILYFYILNYRVIPTEEKGLYATFGDKYQDYATKVNRWI